MRELGVIIEKIKFKGGLNALCWAGAGYLGAMTLCKLDERKTKEAHRKEAKMKEALEGLEKIEKLMDKLDEFQKKNTESDTEGGTN